ncbi:MAG: hypothetical protein JSR47_07975 [Proteobacteria bacterium]|nr:hypothetical protein [Pseudomonadota bacterium]
MAIARWIALGHGVTYDGESLSNGFQPLWVFICAPFFWLVDGDRAAGVRCAMGLHWTFYALGALMTGALFARLFGKLALGPLSGRAVATLVFLSSPFIWWNSFSGLETSLSLACLLASILCYISIDRQNRAHIVGCGAVLGVLVLARVDTVIFVILLAGAQLTRKASWTERIVDAACLSVPAALVSSPWWAYNVIVFGHLMPSSGLALQDWAPTRSRYFWGLGSLIAATTSQFDWFWNADTWPRAFARVPVVGLAAYWLWPELRAFFRTVDRAAAEILSALVLFIAFIAVWYPSSSWASFFYPRYFAPASILGVLFWSLVLLKIVRRIPRGVAAVGLVVLAVQIPVLVAQNYSGPIRQDLLAAQVGLAKEYVPDGDWVAGVQAGTLGFHRDRVANLDGRVNFAALQHRDDINRYLREKGIRWIVDRPWMVRFTLGPDFDKKWKPVAESRGVTLYHYDDASTDPAAGRK